MKGDRESEGMETVGMHEMEVGRRYLVCRIRSAEWVRRRLCEIGLIEGTAVTAVRRGGGISVYLIRGTLQALRREMAMEIDAVPISEVVR